MAERTTFTAYQIPATTLATMKQAAGSFLPDYGDWRFKLDPKKEEEKDPDDPTLDVDADAGYNPGTDAEYGKRYIEDTKPSYREAWDSNNKDVQSEYDTFEEFEVAAIKWNEDNPGTTSGHWESYLISEGTEGNAWSTSSATITDSSGNVIAADDASANSISGNSVMKKRGNNDETPDLQPPEVVIDYDLMLKNAVSQVQSRGSISTPAMHHHSKQIALDIKKNIFEVSVDKQQEASTTLSQIAKNFTEMVGGEGLVKEAFSLVEEGLLSASTTSEEKFILATLMNMDGSVKPRIDENKNIIYPIELPNGGVIPVDTQWVAEVIEKRTKPYALGNEFQSALLDFQNMGRSGATWDKDKVIMNVARLVSDNPHLLASAMLDKGIIVPGALIENIKEQFFPDIDINLRELVYESTQSKEGQEELVELFAKGLENLGHEKYLAGKVVFDKENGGKEGNIKNLISKYTQGTNRA
jgi:hypothetical protein